MSCSQILVDTCGLVKWADGTMPASAQDVLLNAERRYVSVISAWEIELKPELRSRFGEDRFERLIDAMGLEVVDVKLAHIGALHTVRSMAELPHKDPFDHMLIAQALVMDWAVLTCDEHFKQYPRIQVLW